VMGGRWEGPGTGDGHLTARHLQVTTGGRGAASRPRQIGIWLPPSPREQEPHAGADAHLRPAPPGAGDLRTAG
jgi:hypothetical protein